MMAKKICERCSGPLKKIRKNVYQCWGCGKIYEYPPD